MIDTTTIETSARIKKKKKKKLVTQTETLTRQVVE